MEYIITLIWIVGIAAAIYLPVYNWVKDKPKFKAELKKIRRRNEVESFKRHWKAWSK